MSINTSMSTTTLDEPPTNSFDRRKILAEFLKRKRAETQPTSLNIPVRPRRRVPGLTREEVAMKSGISLTWYTWLEQAREVRPSRNAIEALAHTLQMTPTEKDYLLALCNDKQHQIQKKLSLPKELRDFLHQLDPKPAYIFDRHWNVLAWNATSEAIFGSFSTDSYFSKNLLYRMFMDESWKTLFTDWHSISRSVVEQYRFAVSQLNDDKESKSLINFLIQNSSEFANYWKSGAVSSSPVCQKRINHPVGGKLLLSYVCFRPEGAWADLRVTIYCAVSKQDSDKIQSLTSNKINLYIGL